MRELDERGTELREAKMGRPKGEKIQWREERGRERERERKERKVRKERIEGEREMETKRERGRALRPRVYLK